MTLLWGILACMNYFAWDAYCGLCVYSCGVVSFCLFWRFLSLYRDCLITVTVLYCVYDLLCLSVVLLFIRCVLLWKTMWKLLICLFLVWETLWICWYRCYHGSFVYYLVWPVLCAEVVFLCCSLVVCIESYCIDLICFVV